MSEKKHALKFQIITISVNLNFFFPKLVFVVRTVIRREWLSYYFSRHDETRFSRGFDEDWLEVFENSAGKKIHQKKAFGSKRERDWTNNENNQASNTLWVDICVRKTIRFFSCFLFLHTISCLLFLFRLIHIKYAFYWKKFFQSLNLYCIQTKWSMKSTPTSYMLCCVVLHNTQPTDQQLDS